MFPTFLYVVSAAVRIIIRSGSKEAEAAVSRSATGKRNFAFSLLSDCLILNLFNGLIIIFGVGQVIFGVVLTVAGVMISIFGMSSLFTETDLVRELFLAITNFIILGEILDFASYSYIASTGLIVGLIAMILFYTFRISGDFEPTAV